MYEESKGGAIMNVSISKYLGFSEKEVLQALLKDGVNVSLMQGNANTKVLRSMESIPKSQSQILKH